MLLQELKAVRDKVLFLSFSFFLSFLALAHTSLLGNSALTDRSGERYRLCAAKEEGGKDGERFPGGDEREGTVQAR